MSVFYDLASLVLVPSGYKASKVYAQKPLTTDGQLTFSRASTATRVNASGVIEAVASNVPRLDYTNSTCPKLLLEPQRSNIITYSSQFENGAWTKTAIAATANATVSPDGISTADLFTTNDPSGTVYRAYHTSTGGSDATNTISGFFKYGNHPYAYITADYSGSGKYAIFNVQTGVITFTSTGYTSTITDYGNGWYRCTFTGTIDSNNNVQFGLAVSETVYAGTSLANGKTLYVWGAQREYNVSYATSYIPTTSAAVTRLGDDLSTTKLQSANQVGATAGTFFIETMKTDDAIWFNQRILLTNTTTRALLMDINGGQIRLRTWDASSAGTSITTSGLTNGVVKYLVKWDGTNIKVFANGVLVGSSAQPSYAYTTYAANESPSFSNNEISQVLFFNTALTDAQCVEITQL